MQNGPGVQFSNAKKKNGVGKRGVGLGVGLGTDSSTAKKDILKGKEKCHKKFWH